MDHFFSTSLKIIIIIIIKTLSQQHSFLCSHTISSSSNVPCFSAVPPNPATLPLFPSLYNRTIVVAAVYDKLFPSLAEEVQCGEAAADS